MVFNAALDDGIVPRNPFSAGSVRPPKVRRPKVTPWTLAQLDVVTEALDERYRAMLYLGAPGADCGRASCSGSPSMTLTFSVAWSTSSDRCV
jgi:hypothetical protein